MPFDYIWGLRPFAWLQKHALLLHEAPVVVYRYKVCTISTRNPNTEVHVQSIHLFKSRTGVVWLHVLESYSLPLLAIHSTYYHGWPFTRVKNRDKIECCGFLHEYNSFLSQIMQHYYYNAELSVNENSARYQIVTFVFIMIFFWLLF